MCFLFLFLCLRMAIISAMFRRLPSRARYSVAIYLWCLPRNKFGSVAFFVMLWLLKHVQNTDNERAIESNSLYFSFSEILVAFFFFPFWRVFVSVLVSRFSCRLNSYFVSLHFPIMCIFCLVAGSWKSPPSKCTHNKSKTSSSVHIDICMCVCLCVCDILLSAMQCVHSTQPLVISAMSILHASLNLVPA